MVPQKQDTTPLSSLYQFHYYHHCLGQSVERPDYSTRQVFHSSKKKKAFRMTANTTDRRALKLYFCVVRELNFYFKIIFPSFLFFVVFFLGVFRIWMSGRNS